MTTYLEKYADPDHEEKKSKQYNTKLPEALARDFEEMCAYWNMKPGKALRLLVYEEVQRFRQMKKSKDTQKVPKEIFHHPSMPPAPARPQIGVNPRYV